MYSIPSVLNDVARQFFEYVGETNREKLHNRSVAYAFQYPIIDPSGTRDPFHYNIEKFYGASDHQVHLDWNPRIPAVQFGNWPDAVYHSSDDSPANQDPTQMKRAAFLMIAVGNVFATAGPAEAVAVANTAMQYANSRAAADLGDALNLISASNASTLNESYKEALNLVRMAYARERADIRSAGSLAIGDRTALSDIAALEQTFAGAEAIDVQRVQQAYSAKAKRSGVTVALTPALTPSEQAASKLIPTRKEQSGGGRGGGGGGGAGANASLTGYYTQEARNFADGVRSILDIRNAISAEFGPVSVDNVVRFFRDGEAAGAYTITTKK
jgi:hypothetical protein